jgi:diguanylate cyclase (GGDEF)-like protein
LRRISVGQVFAIILLVAVAPIGAINVWFAWSAKRELVDSNHASLSQIAEFAAFQYRQMLASVEQALALEPLLLAVTLTDQAACNDLLKRRVTSHSFILAMLAVSRDGIVRCASAAQGMGTDLSDRAYFREALATDRFVIGEPVVARPVPRLVAPVALRLAGADPARRGETEPVVMAAALELDGFARRVQELAGGLPDAGSSQRLVWIVDPRGVVMSDPSSPDRRGSRASFWREEARGGDRRLIGADFEGRELALAVSSRLPGGLFIVVGAPLEAITAEANWRLTASAMVGLIGLSAGLAVAFFVVTFLILKPLGSLTAAAHMLKAGKSDMGLPSRPFIGELADLRGSFVDMAKVIAERERLLRTRNAELTDLSSQDPLTGVANRRALDRYLSEAWPVAAGSSQPLSLLFVDVDHFKLYNDTHGHQAGDAVLRAIAHALRHLPLREADLVARYGGEEFVIVLPGTPLAGAVAVAERALAAIRALGIPHHASPKGSVSVSIGVASSRPDRDEHPDGLIASADAALYRAKADGRDRVHAEMSPSIGLETFRRSIDSASMANQA